jgi:alkyldihydroxyacetonephosphate synthase
MNQQGKVSVAALEKITAIVGDGGVSVLGQDVFSYSRDLWPRSIIQLEEGRFPHLPDAVAWPSTEEQVAELVRLANAERFPLIPFGAGSGVCGGTLPVAGGLVMDLKKLNKIWAPDPESMTASFEPGVIGQHAEMEMVRQGYTIGHFPSSIYCSSVGGWIAARGAGQESSRYGKIEDMVVSLRFVTGSGDIVDTAECGTPDQANALNQLIIGSEGTMGVVTRAVLRINKNPSVILPRGTIFPDVASGIEATRRIFRMGLRPTVVRLYDEFDTIVGFGKGKLEAEQKKKEKKPRGGLLAEYLEEFITPGDLTEAVLRRMLSAPALLNKIADYIPGGCMQVTVFSGDDREMLEAEAKAANEVYRACGGTDQGEAPGAHWLKHRYGVSYKQPKIFHTGGFVDTMEVAAPWDRIIPLYGAVRRAVSPHAFIMAHFSHAYADGCSIYFTFVGVRKTGRAEALYDRIWDAAQEAVISIGATVSHHHGVGISKGRFLARQHLGGMEYYRGVKSAFDPNNVMNPGKLGLQGG